MTSVRTDDLKISTFDTWAVIEAGRAAAVKTVEVKVDHRAATRQAVVLALRRDGFAFETRSEWNAKPGTLSDGPDWDYHGIAIHHAGNSFSCSADGATQLRKAEQIDIKKFGHISYHYAVACDGSIYEALDIREKGAHIGAGNTGVVGIVLLADLSIHGEAYQREYGKKSVIKRIAGLANGCPINSTLQPMSRLNSNSMRCRRWSRCCAGSFRSPNWAGIVSTRHSPLARGEPALAPTA